MSASLSELLDQARAHEQRGDFAAARAQYERALALAPQHPEALLKVGALAQVAGDHADAERRFATALARMPAGPARSPAALARAQVALLLAQARRAMGRVEAADDAFAVATAAAPDNVNAWLARGGFAMEVELAAPAAPATTLRGIARRSPLPIASTWRSTPSAGPRRWRRECRRWWRSTRWRCATPARGATPAPPRRGWRPSARRPCRTDRRRHGRLRHFAADGGRAAGRSGPAARGHRELGAAVAAAGRAARRATARARRRRARGHRPPRRPAARRLPVVGLPRSRDGLPHRRCVRAPRSTRASNRSPMRSTATTAARCGVA